MSYYEDGAGARTEYAISTLWSLVARLKFDGKLELHIADDSEDIEGNNIEKLQTIALRCWGSKGSYTCSHHNGIGASLNAALSKVNDLWLYTTDDWQLIKDLDLNKAVKLIKDCNYDYVRLGPLHPNLDCRTQFQVGVGWWLHIGPSRGFAFATRPFIATLEMFNKIGKFDERENSYEVERLYAEKVMRSTLNIAGYLSDATEWNHLGELYPVGERNFSK